MRYKEHIRELKNSGENSKFALHIQNTGHKYRNMEETLDVLHIQHKGRMMNTLKNYHIYEAHIQGMPLNKALTKPYNPIFKIITRNQPTCNFIKPYNQTPPLPTDNPHLLSGSLMSTLPPPSLTAFLSA
jgi:hypothetical protein